MNKKSHKKYKSNNKILKNSLKVCYYRVAEEFAN